MVLLIGFLGSVFLEFGLEGYDLYLTFLLVFGNVVALLRTVEDVVFSLLSTLVAVVLVLMVVSSVQATAAYRMLPEEYRWLFNFPAFDWVDHLMKHVFEVILLVLLLALLAVVFLLL